MVAPIEPFVDRNGLERKALAILKQVGNLGLVGETGTGKTHFVHWLAEKHRWKLYEYSLNADTTRWDLIASDVLRRGETEVRSGIVTEWLRDRSKGVKVLYLDEYWYASAGVTTLLNQLTDFRRSIWVPELKGTLERTPDHYVIISYNPAEKSGYVGVHPVNIAQMRRFEFLRFDYLGILEETKLLKPICGYEFARRLAEFAAKIRTNYKLGRLTRVITLGNLYAYARACNDGLEEQEVVDVALNQFPDEERGAVARLWEQRKVEGG